MQLKIIILILMLVTLKGHCSLTTGIILAGEGELQKAYKELENSFAIEKDTNLKAQASLILSRANKSKLTNSPAYYAKFALKYNHQLSKKERADTIRIIADAQFAMGNIKESIKEYKKIISLLPIDDHLYGYTIYKLGWALVNLNKYKETIFMWKDFLKKMPNAPLAKNIFYDLGKFWAEHSYSKKQLTGITETIFTENSDFINGVMNGLKRKSRSNPVNITKWKINNKAIHALILGKLMAQQTSSFTNTCKTLSYIKRNQLNKKKYLHLIGKNNIFSMAIKCIQKVKKHSGLSQLLNKFELTAKDSLILAISLINENKLKEANKLIERISLKIYKEKDNKDIQDLTDRIISHYIGTSNYVKIGNLLSIDYNRSISEHIFKCLRNNKTDILKYTINKISHPNAKNKMLIATVNELYFSIKVSNKVNTEIKNTFNLTCNELNRDEIAQLLDYFLSKNDNLLVYKNLACFDKIAKNKSAYNNLTLLFTLKKLTTCHNPGQFQLAVEMCQVNNLIFSNNTKMKISPNLKRTVFSKDIKLLIKVATYKNKIKKLSLHNIPTLYKGLVWLNKKISKAKWQNKGILASAIKKFNVNIELFNKKIKTLSISRKKLTLLRDKANDLRIKDSINV